MIVARTQCERELLDAAVEENNVVPVTKEPSLLPCSRANLLRIHCALGVRPKVLRWLGVAVPVYRRFLKRRYWQGVLSLRNTLQRFAVTPKRVSRRGRRSGVEPSGLTWGQP